MLLTGTFGELRPEHFHAGIDIKSKNGTAGDPVVAAAAGYISRLRVDESGYGNSVFIAHPNGFTTVYGHLHEFAPELLSIIREHQFRNKSFNVDIALTENTITVNAGKKIGTMGNTGSSKGVHLHFEVRKTDSQNPVNPLLFNFPVTDNVAPKMHALRVYSLNDKNESLFAHNHLVIGAGQNYRLKGDTLFTGHSKVGLALKVYDHFDKVSNWNGVFRVSLYENETFTYSFEFQEFSFSETRYINAHCDYIEKVSRNSYFNRIYSLPGNQLSIYQRQGKNGVIEVSEEPKKINLIAADIAGNVSSLEFWIKKDSKIETQLKSRNYDYIFPFNERNLVQREGLFIDMPVGRLYEDLYLEYSLTLLSGPGRFSSMHQIHNNKTPVHDYFEIGIKPDLHIADSLQNKSFVAYCQGKSVMNCGGEWKNGYLNAKVRKLGAYCIMLDTVPPEIKPISFQYDLRKTKTISFRIYDNLQVAPNVKGLTYDAAIDGEWVLVEFDKKYARLTHELTTPLESGEHVFKLVVKDAVGNQTTFESKFQR
jgi:hypothetical protein